MVLVSGTLVSVIIKVSWVFFSTGFDSTSETLFFSSFFTIFLATSFLSSLAFSGVFSFGLLSASVFCRSRSPRCSYSFDLLRSFSSFVSTLPEIA
jgi:hypothetical protein